MVKIGEKECKLVKLDGRTSETTDVQAVEIFQVPTAGFFARNPTFMRAE
jgi:hypothetical protein